MNQTIRHIFILLMAVNLLQGCQREEDKPATFSGYVEARYAYISIPQAGWLEKLTLKEGNEVKEGHPLFLMDTQQQNIFLKRASAELLQAQSKLKDLEKGARNIDLEVISNQIVAQEAQLRYSHKEKLRWKKIADNSFSSKSKSDLATANYKIAQAKLDELKTRYEQAKLSSRDDQIEAARQAVNQASQNLAEQQRQLNERSIKSRIAGTIDQVFYQQGEYVNPGSPVLSVIINNEKKVRFFVPQKYLHQIAMDKKIELSMDGSKDIITASINYIAKDAEFTPPVIYSKDVRNKLVFMIEAKLPDSVSLNPGQPVDVRLPSS